MATYSRDTGSSRIAFTLHSTGDDSGYLAVGISDDATMGADLVLACSSSLEEDEAVAAWNVEGSKNCEEGVEGVEFEGVKVTKEDGDMTCWFKVKRMCFCR